MKLCCLKLSRDGSRAAALASLRGGGAECRCVGFEDGGAGLTVDKKLLLAEVVRVNLLGFVHCTRRDANIEVNHEFG